MGRWIPPSPVLPRQVQKERGLPVGSTPSRWGGRHVRSRFRNGYACIEAGRGGDNLQRDAQTRSKGKAVDLRGHARAFGLGGNDGRSRRHRSRGRRRDLGVVLQNARNNGEAEGQSNDETASPGIAVSAVAKLRFERGRRHGFGGSVCSGGWHTRELQSVYRHP